MAVTLTNTSPTIITLTEDGFDMIIKKAYLTVTASGSNINLRWQDYESVSNKFVKTYLESDVSSPSHTDAADLVSIIEGWINNTSGVYVSKSFQPLSFTGSGTSFTITETFTGSVMVIDGIPLKEGVGFTIAGSAVTLTEASASNDNVQIWGMK